MSSDLRMKKTISSALLTLLKNKDLEAITAADISLEANISKRTLYNHFKDKYVIFLWWWKENMKPYEDADLDAYTLHLVQLLKRYRDEFRHVLSYRGQNNFREEVIPHDIAKYKRHIRKEVLKVCDGDLLIRFAISTSWYFWSCCLWDDARLDHVLHLLETNPDAVIINGAYHVLGSYISYPVLSDGEHL